MRKKAQTDNLSVSSRSRRLTKAQKAAQQRLKDANDAAFAVKRDVDQVRQMYKKFKDVVAQMREPLQTIRHFFAHRKKGEQLLGKYATGEQWAKKELGMTYHHVCYVLNAQIESPRFLLPAATRWRDILPKSTATRDHPPQPEETFWIRVELTDDVTLKLKELAEKNIKDPKHGKVNRRTAMGKEALRLLQRSLGLPERKPPKKWEKDWKGMPGFVMYDLSPWKTLKVHFATFEDVEQFAKHIGQRVTYRTPSIWYPPQEKARVVNVRFSGTTTPKEEEEPEMSEVEL